MPQLKFKIGDTEFEFVGTLLEIQNFVRGLISSPFRLPPSQTSLLSESSVAKTPQVTPSQSRITKNGKLDLRLPSDEEVKNYIMSTPDYRHDTFDLQEHFFGRTFKSRDETMHMYHKFARQIREVRQKIETEQGGNFESEIGEGGVKQFIFRESLIKNPPRPNVANVTVP